MKKRIYIETTVVSYLAARPSRDIIIAGHQTATRELWPELSARYETYISALVFEEAKRGDPNQAQVRLEAIRPNPMLDREIQVSSGHQVVRLAPRKLEPARQSNRPRN